MKGFLSISKNSSYFIMVIQVFFFPVCNILTLGFLKEILKGDSKGSVSHSCEKDCGKQLPSVELFFRRVKPLLERMLHPLKVEWALPLVMVVVEDWGC